MAKIGKILSVSIQDPMYIPLNNISNASVAFSKIPEGVVWSE